MDLSDLLMGSLQWDIIDLANRLRQERLFVTSEQQHLQELNEKVVAVSSRLAELAWVTAQQRDNLNILIVARPDCKPAACCYKANTLENTRFVDGLKLLGFQECLSYGEFLQSLRTSPSLLASCLVAGDRLMPNMMHGIIHSLSAGLFGSSLLPEDNVLVLRLLQHLTRLQIVPSDNPRRLLRKRCCAFARLYGEFHESLFSAKLFLTAALHHPIMQLLVDHDVFLDIDPDKATIRFSPEDRVKRFGKENSPEYPELILEYRQWTIGRLVVVTSRFLSSLRENMHCFPTGVCWLVRQIASLLSKSSNIQPKEVSAICTDLVFTHFICPAIVDPEPYGITDAPISEIARFNLMQVAKIIQTLAMTKYEEIDPKVLDLYSQFDKDCVSCLLDAILDSDGEDLVGPLTLGDNSSNKLQGLSRSSALFTETELNNLVTFVQAIASDSTESQVDKKELATVLQQLPSTLSSSGLKHPTTSTPPETPKKMVGLLGKVGKSRSRAPVNGGNEERTEIDDGHAEDVLVIPFSPEVRERVGFLPEHKVLCMKDLECEVSVNLSGPPQEGGVEGGGGSGSGGSEEKRSRAHSHDDGSIGNTSDNLEAVSEAASNHSVASSLELETEDQNDNLSDMVSANVSGRGTPNISGRDTPSSQITEGDEGLGGARGGVGDQRPLDFRPPSTSKQSRSDIDDKFGKFEIKKLLEGDETVSMVSDTWSTDVLASDSETVEQSESQRLVPDVEVRRPDVSQQLLLDVSETASEAWSTDVLASDTERLTEVDTDDTGSVARSDDTARSEVDDPLAQSTPLGTSSGFRPIREPSLHVPASPTRVEVLGAWNVTGRGGMKADYRRRVVEYVDSNRRDRENQPNFAKPAPMRSIDEARMIHVIDKIDKTADTRPPTVSRALPLTPLNISTSTSAATQTNGDLIAMPVAPREAPPLVNGTQSLANHITPKLLPSTRQLAPATVDSKSDVLDGMEAVRLSSASLNSTSSSSSGSDPRPNTVTPTPESPATVLVNGHHPQAKPTTSTGAIPKSISFDKTAERGDKELLDDDQKQKRGSFFRNFKLPFKNRRGKSLRGADDLNVRCLDPVLGPGDGRCRLPDTTDDILAKYRRKPADAPAADGQRKGKPTVDVEEDERLTIDPTRVEQSYAFGDAKRKLRMVLSTADLQQQQRPAPQSAGRENELVLFLQLQLAEAINLQDRPLIAHLHETLRCIRLFDSEGCRKLFHSLKEDYQKRAPYINYLVRCRQGLLSTLAHLDRLMERVKSDQDVCSRFLVAVCVRMFLERHDSVVQRFIVEFQQLTLADEKMDLLDNFLHQLASDMEHDPTWQVANESQLQQAHMAVERAMMSRVYMNALYPNGDGDMSRDHVLHEHMDKLSKVVTPNHKDLRIPNRFQYECPWASAQAEVSAIAAYKTPRDKLQCVLRCTLTIMNLLAMAAGIPAADDFTPVLVFVLIKANPPALLSTIQYIDSFYANRLEGEDQYWWTQFCSAVEFIKTMDYTD